MNKPRLTYLFQAYFNKSATPVEREELMRLLVLSENDEQVKALIVQSWQQFKGENKPFIDIHYERMLSNILKRGTIHQTAPVISGYRRSFSWPQIAAAAAIVFLVIIGAVFWLKSTQAVGPIAGTINEVKGSKERIMPGGNKAVLTLSDGSHIMLDSTNQGTLANQGNTKVMKLNTATLAYSQGNSVDQKIVYNTLSTPRGGQYQLILPDGTKVWLNASSSIHFPTVFKGKDRNVTITGEAYFEVTKNPTMPFIVKAKDMEVQVLGTHFNVMAYDDERSMNTTLLEGSVKVSQGTILKTLVPGQQSEFGKNGTIDVVDANLDQVVAWKNGWFQFNSAGINEIMREISRWYDVDILYEGKVPTGHFSGIVSRSNDIKQVLKIMQAGGVQFKIEGKKVIVLS